MTWRQSRRLKLFWLLWIPAACFGQNSGGGSRIESNPLSVYAPPCISQVKENIGVQCQVTPKGGMQPYSYGFTGGFPTGMSMSNGLGGGRWDATSKPIGHGHASWTATSKSRGVR